MDWINAPLLLKLLGLALVPVAFALWWTFVQLIRGDRFAFMQAKEAHPTWIDVLFGRAMHRPANRPDAPMSDGVVLKFRGKTPYWYLNRRMSDEQYDRMTK